MISVTGLSDSAGRAVVVAAAASAARALGADPDAAGLLVRLLADDARVRCSVDGDASPLTLTAAVDGTEVVLALRDVGEPVLGPPDTVLALAGQGLATAVDAGIDGTGNVATVRLALPGHGRVLDDTGLEVVAPDAAAVDDDVHIRRLVADDAGALTRLVYRCYGWTYPYAEMYYPDRIAAAIDDGRRFGAVAVTGDGEVVTHVGAVELAEGLVLAGGGVTDPRFRRRGLLAATGAEFGACITERGTRAYCSEPVLTHSATQHMAWTGNSKFMGMYLNVRGPLRQVDITDGMLPRRSSLFVAYQPIEPLEADTLWVPLPYQAMVNRVLEPTGWPLVVARAEAKPAVPASSVLGSSLDTLNNIGVIRVEVAGADLVEVLDEAMAGLVGCGVDMIKVFLPAGQPATATVGAGLAALQLGYAALLPNYGELGHALVLQWVRDPDIDDSEWVYADDWLRDLAQAIGAQAKTLGEQATAMRRRQARRQQLFAALDDTDDR